VACLKQTSDGFGGICVSGSHTLLLVQIPPFVLLVKLLAAAQSTVSSVAVFHHVVSVLLAAARVAGLKQTSDGSGDICVRGNYELMLSGHVADLANSTSASTQCRVSQL
jgi:hypothetical protein